MKEFGHLVNWISSSILHDNRASKARAFIIIKLKVCGSEILLNGSVHINYVKFL